MVPFHYVLEMWGSGPRLLEEPFELLLVKDGRGAMKSYRKTQLTTPLLLVIYYYYYRVKTINHQSAAAFSSRSFVIKLIVVIIKENRCIEFNLHMKLH